FESEKQTDLIGIPGYLPGKRLSHSFCHNRFSEFCIKGLHPHFYFHFCSRGRKAFSERLYFFPIHPVSFKAELKNLFFPADSFNPIQGHWIQFSKAAGI